MPYGISGIMLARRSCSSPSSASIPSPRRPKRPGPPQHDLPFGILLSLGVCTLLYIAVSAVVTGMVPYPNINTDAPIAAAFDPLPGQPDTTWLRTSRGLIAAGGLAGMTSVLLVLFLSQGRIFMAMSRDGLLPKIFSTVLAVPHAARGHHPHRHRDLCYGCADADLRPGGNGQRGHADGLRHGPCGGVGAAPSAATAERPFRCPAIWLVAPAGIFINISLTLFLSVATWMRLVIWLAAGLVIYFSYSVRHSRIAEHLLHEIATPRKEITGTRFDAE